MPLRTVRKVAREFGKNQNDTGSAGVQIALLTKKIKHLSKHLKANMKDFHSRYGLIKMIGKRRRLLRYLSKTDGEKYQTVLKKLDLRK